MMLKKWKTDSDVTLNRIKLYLKNIYVFIHVLVNNQDIIYYGFYFHSHIGANKLFRKIMFTDVGRFVSCQNLLLPGWQSVHTKIRDVIFRAWHSKG